MLFLTISSHATVNYVKMWTGRVNQIAIIIQSYRNVFGIHTKGKTISYIRTYVRCTHSLYIYMLRCI